MVFHYQGYKKMIIGVITCLFMVLLLPARAQDTSGKQTIEIISAYKPVFRAAVKLNFSPQPLPPFTNVVKFDYKLPVQPLNLQLVPASLKPMALKQDTSSLIAGQDYLKIGYGNLRSPYASAGLHFGKRENISGLIAAEHFSQKGEMRVQKFSFTDLNGRVTSMGAKHVFDAGIGYRHQVNWLYAADSTLFQTKDDSLRKPYQTVDVSVRWANKNAKESGVGYQPSLRASFFHNGISTENNIRLLLPVSLHFGNDYILSVTGDADFTFFNPDNAKAYANHLFGLKGVFEIYKEKWQLKTGVMPVWYADKLYVLPVIRGEFKVKQDQLFLIAGWEGSVRKNNYESLVAINPWINQPLSQFNTRIQDVYGGLKGRALNNTLFFQFQFGWQQLTDQPLFENSAKPSVFEIRRETRLNSLQTKAEIHYRLDNRLEIRGTAQINQFFGQQTESAPWHLIPVQLNGGLKWKPAEKLSLTADLFAWRGGLYKESISGDERRLPSVMDVNAGAEFSVGKGLFAWLQFSNLLNTDYQRWHQYPVFGFQVHGGIKLTFDAKR